MKFFPLRLAALIFFLATANSYAVDNPKLLDLSKQIMETKDCSLVKAKIEESSGMYFKENKYSEFADFLSSVLKQKNDCQGQVNYYIALNRYRQLKYLEESQGWDEYFAKGNDYRQQITESSQKAIDMLTPGDELLPATRLLLWQFHRDQQDAFHEQALNELIGSLNEYANTGNNIQVIKLAADTIYSYGEKAKAREAYKIYVSKLLNSSVADEELKNIAANFLKEGNIELAETVYDDYIERMAKSGNKEKLCQALTDLAQEFALNKDMAYAEKLFARAAEAQNGNCLDERLNYLRAFNLEKAKDYAKAKQLYLDFSQKYQQSAHHDEALFKAAVISTYILSDKKTGIDYFVQLTEQEKISPQSVSSLYHLGLVSQWENDTKKAKAYYNKLIEKAGDGFPEDVLAAKERLKEIEGSLPQENNLKLFLDRALQGATSEQNASQLSLSVSPFVAKKEQEVKINSSANSISAGCLPVDLQYFWSGDLGMGKPQANAPAFSTSYKQPGTKVIFLVAHISGSYLERTLDMLDIE